MLKTYKKAEDCMYAGYNLCRFKPLNGGSRLGTLILALFKP